MPKNTRARIIEAATNLFYERGYKATPTKAIADTAGVNEVTIFRQFGNKETLLEEIISEKYDVFYTFRKAFFTHEITYNLADDLRNINQKYLQVLHKNSKVIAIMFSRSMGHFDSHFLNFPKGFRQFLISYLETMNKKGLIIKADYQQIVDHFISTHIGYVLIQNRFDNSIIQLNDKKLIEENITLYCTRLQETH